MVSFYLGHWWGNLKWMVEVQGGALHSRIGRGGGANCAGGTEDGIGASHAACTQSGAETAGGGGEGRRGRCPQEGQGWIKTEAHQLSLNR